MWYKNYLKMRRLLNDCKSIEEGGDKHRRNQIE